MASTNARRRRAPTASSAAEAHVVDVNPDDIEEGADPPFERPDDLNPDDIDAEVSDEGPQTPAPRPAP